jgi:hypothetical protein
MWNAKVKVKNDIALRPWESMSELPNDRRKGNQMETPKCPKCSYYAETYKTPIGKIVSNPAAYNHPANQGKEMVCDDCNACYGKGFVPDIVCSEIRRCFPNDAESILKDLRWSMDHFSFSRWGMYIGIEMDGYIHS